jgi:hypothetical protein
LKKKIIVETNVNALNPSSTCVFLYLRFECFTECAWSKKHGPRKQWAKDPLTIPMILCHLPCMLWVEMNSKFQDFMAFIRKDLL